jgi:hypothetical protein
MVSDHLLDAGGLGAAIAASLRGGISAPPSRWTTALDAETTADVVLADPWMSWEVGLDAARVWDALGDLRTLDAPMEWLRRHDTWPLTVQFATPDPGARPRLRCDMPVCDELDLYCRVKELREAFLHVLGRANPATVRTSMPLVQSTALTVLCEEAGWDARDGPGGVRVKLDTVRGSSDVTLSPTESGGARCVLETVRFESDRVEGGDQRIARTTVAHLLLETANRVRFVRPFARQEEVDLVFGFEINLGVGPTAFEIGCALGALRTAWESCGPETVVLATTDLAARLASLPTPPPWLRRERP